MTPRGSGLNANRWEATKMGKSCCVAILLLVSLVGCAHISSGADLALRARQPGASADWQLTLTIPAETRATVQLLSGIHTRFSRVDDPIKAQLLQPVVIDGKVALPPGTLLEGRVTAVRSASRLNRSAELALRFEQIALPDGDVEPIVAVLAMAPANTRLDREGHLKGARSVSWKGLTGGIAAIGSFAVAKATFASSAAFWPILPAAGTAWLGYEFLWRRGGDVHLPPQTSCQIRLDYPLTVRVLW
jgi:hypothetical protein